MKANEIMLGDILQGFLPDTYMRVVGIPNEYRLEVVTANGTYMELSIDDVRPIELTPEILEKNEFEHISRSSYYDYDDGEGVIVRCDTWNKRLKIIRDLNVVYDSGDYADIYVYILQHALKLTDIDKEIIV